MLDEIDELAETLYLTEDLGERDDWDKLEHWVRDGYRQHAERLMKCGYTKGIKHAACKLCPACQGNGCRKCHPNYRGESI